MSEEEVKLQGEEEAKPQGELKGLLRELKSEMEELKRDNAMLMQVADKKQMARLMQRKRKDLPTYVGVRAMEIDEKLKLIMGWRTVKNIVAQSPQTGAWFEDQRIEVIFQDGSREEMDYRVFVRNYKLIRGKVVGESVSDEGRSLDLVLVEEPFEGEEITISDKFIN